MQYKIAKVVAFALILTLIPVAGVKASEAENYIVTVDESGEEVHNESNPVAYPNEVENWEPMGWVTESEYERYLADKAQYGSDVYAEDYAYTGGYIESGESLYGIYGQYETVVLRAYDIDNEAFLEYEAPSMYINEAVTGEAGSLNEMQADQSTALTEIRSGVDETWDYLGDAMQYAVGSEYVLVSGRDLKELYTDYECTQVFDETSPFENGLTLYAKIEVSKEKGVVVDTDTNVPSDEGNPDKEEVAIQESPTENGLENIQSEPEDPEVYAPKSDEGAWPQVAKTASRSLKTAGLVAGSIACVIAAGACIFILPIFKRKKKIVGSIVGTKIENPTITLANLDNGIQYRTIADASGCFVFESVNVEWYSLTVYDADENEICSGVVDLRKSQADEFMCSKNIFIITTKRGSTYEVVVEFR